ncbi:MAG: stage II sporulation protein M [Clostridia bacterium]|nr:stage II sporulation protein M [Clostridia bacterium]
MSKSKTSAAKTEGVLEKKQFISENAPHWKKLATQTKKFKKSFFRPTKAQVDEYIILYNTVSNHLAYSRTYYGEDQTTQYLNKLLGSAHAVIYAEKKTPFSAFFNFFAEGFPLLFRKHIKIFTISTLAFVLAGLVAFIFTAIDVENALAFIDGSTINNLRAEGQYDSFVFEMNLLQNVMIGTNNIKVCILAFVLGFTLGIGTLYVLITNGINVGVLAAIYFKKGQSLFFWSLIVPHGVPELFAIFLSGAAGLIIGYSLINPKRLSRKDSFIVAARDAGKLLLGCIPILIIAALIEGFFTPLDISYGVKYAVAAAELVLLVLYLCLPGRIKKKKTLTR